MKRYHHIFGGYQYMMTLFYCPAFCFNNLCYFLLAYSIYNYREETWFLKKIDFLIFDGFTKLQFSDSYEVLT